MKISHEAGIKNGARLIRPSNGAPAQRLIMILYYPMARLIGRNGVKQLIITGQMLIIQMRIKRSEKHILVKIQECILGL